MAEGTAVPESEYDPEDLARGAARRLAEATAAVGGVAAVLLPVAGAITRTFAFSLAGIPGAEVIGIAAPIGQLALTGLGSCFPTFLLVLILVVPETFRQRYVVPTRFVQVRGRRPHPYLVVYLTLWAVVGVLTPFPQGLLTLVAA